MVGCPGLQPRHMQTVMGVDLGASVHDQLEERSGGGVRKNQRASEEISPFYLIFPHFRLESVLEIFINILEEKSLFL